MKPIRVRERGLEAPAIVNAVFEATEGTDPADLEKLANCGWCDIEEVRHALNRRMRKFGGKEVNDPRDIFKLYGLLNGHEDGRPKVTWHTHSYYEFYGDPPPGSLSRCGMLVPALWVQNLLKFASAGFTEIIWQADVCAFYSNRKNTHHYFIGIKVDASRHELKCVGKEYRVTPMGQAEPVAIV